MFLVWSPEYFMSSTQHEAPRYVFFYTAPFRVYTCVCGVTWLNSVSQHWTSSIPPPPSLILSVLLFRIHCITFYMLFFLSTSLYFLIPFLVSYSFPSYLYIFCFLFYLFGYLIPWLPFFLSYPFFFFLVHCFIGVPISPPSENGRLLNLRYPWTHPQT